MDKILQALNQYDVVTCIIPGLVFCQLTDWMYCTKFMGTDAFNLLVTSYIFGLIISRIGSIIIEPFCEKVGIIHKAPYSEWVQAKKQDDEIDTITTKSTVYRSLSALIFFQMILYICWLFELQHIIFTRCGIFMLCLAAMGFIFFAYRKQVSYVHKRVQCVLQCSRKLD